MGEECSNEQKDFKPFKAKTQSEWISEISWMDKKDKEALLLLTKLGFFIDFDGPVEIPESKKQKVIFEFRAWRSNLPGLILGPS